MRRQTIINSIVIILAFLIAHYGRDVLNFFMPISFSTNLLIISYAYSWWVFPALLVVGILYGFKDSLKNLGLNKGFLIGFIFAFITVLPMLISSAIIGRIADNLDFTSLFLKTICAGFFEEFLFRGFLFGILFRKLKWGFIPASILGALIFGLGHIYQGSTPLETLGVFAVTAVGAVWFAWLYIEWGSNLWVPIFLHTLMNVSWLLFDVGNNALGGLYTNIFRAITIALTIIITIRYHKKRGLNINRKNLIINNNS